MMRSFRFAVALLLAGPVFATTPPPPPEFVWNAGTILIDPAVKDVAKIAPLFADDVAVTANGQPLATGKAAWLAWWTKDRAHHFGRTIGYSESGNELLMFDIFDTVDFSTDPPPPGDPRIQTRSTYYRFGGDHLIHSVQIVTVGEFYMTPKR